MISSLTILNFVVGICINKNSSGPTFSTSPETKFVMLKKSVYIGLFSPKIIYPNFLEINFKYSSFSSRVSYSN